MEIQYTEKVKHQRNIFYNGVMTGILGASVAFFGFSSLFKPIKVERSELKNGQEIVRTVDIFEHHSPAFIQDPENKNTYLSPSEYEKRLVNLSIKKTSRDPKDISDSLKDENDPYKFGYYHGNKGNNSTKLHSSVESKVEAEGEVK